jgi:hypothetical protein
VLKGGGHTVRVEMRNAYIVLTKNDVGKEAMGKVGRVQWRVLLLAVLTLRVVLSWFEVRRAYEPEVRPE